MRSACVRKGIRVYVCVRVVIPCVRVCTWVRERVVHTCGKERVRQQEKES